MEKEELEKLLVRAGAYTARYEKSAREVKAKLNKWSDGSINNEEVEAILSRLQQDGYIDEKRLAESYVRDKVGYLKKGPMLIKWEMREKGIPDKYIEAAIKQVTYDEWLEALSGYIIPRLERQKQKAKNGYDLRRRLYNLVYQRGFTADMFDDLYATLDTDLDADDE